MSVNSELVKELMVHLDKGILGHLMQRADSLEKIDAGKDWGQEEKGTTEDEMAGWYHWLDGHEFEQTPGDSEGQGSLVCCCCSWGRKESDMTEWLNNNATIFKIRCTSTEKESGLWYMLNKKQRYRTMKIQSYLYTFKNMIDDI